MLDFIIYGNRLFFNSADKLLNNALFVLDLKYDEKPMKISSNAARDIVYWENFIYYERENATSFGIEIMRMDLTDYSEESVYDYNSYNLRVYNNNIYFIRDDDHLGSGSMFAANLKENGDSEGIHQIGTRKSSYFNIYDNQIFYRVKGIDPKMYKSQINGQNESIVTDDYDTVYFEFINGLLFFTNNVSNNKNDGLYTMTYEGTNISLLKQGIYAKNILFINDDLFFYDKDGANGTGRFYKLDIIDLSLSTIDNS